MPIIKYTQLRAHPLLTKQTSSHEQNQLIGAVSHMCGWRKTMQDTDIFEFNIDGRGTNLFAVFDGHGGGQIAVYAKLHFKKILLQNQNFIKGNFQIALKQVFPALDAEMMTPQGTDEIFDIKQQLDQTIKKQFKFQWEEDSDDEIQCVAGAAAIVCLMTKQTIYIASVGDARCLISSHGVCKQLSFEHKPNLPQQKARIQSLGGKIKNNRINGKLAMSRSLGDFSFKAKRTKKMSEQMVISDPHIDKIKNENIEFILLGCDGIWQGYHNDWYFNTVNSKYAQKNTPSAILQHILDTVVSKTLQGQDGHDNMTGILLINKNSSLQQQERRIMSRQ